MDNKNKRLNNREAMEALLAGYKIREVHLYSEDRYIFLDKETNYIINDKGTHDNFSGFNWEIYEAPKQKVVKTIYEQIFRNRNTGEYYSRGYVVIKDKSCEDFELVKTIEHKIEVEE